MSDIHGLTKENILATLPIALQNDTSVLALADTAAEILSRRPEEIDRLSIYPRIDQLDENLLDILAYDFKVDWWDAEYSLDEKRKTMQDSWRVHKLMGTRYAVETALRAIYPDANVKEWFEYEGGRPYHFRLEIDTSKIAGDTPERQERAIKRVWYYKNLRSHCDEIIYTVETEPTTLYVGGTVETNPVIGVPPGEDIYDFQRGLYIGGTVETNPVIGVPTGEDNYHFQGNLHVGGSIESDPIIGVPTGEDNYHLQGNMNVGGTIEVQPQIAGQEDTSLPDAVTILRMGGVCTIISNISQQEA